MVAVISATACTRTVYVPVQNHVRTVDTVYAARWRSDSVYLRDSVYVRDSVYLETGKDTVKVTRYRILERMHWLGSLHARVDTVHDVQIKEVVKEVPVESSDKKNIPLNKITFFICSLITIGVVLGGAKIVRILTKN